MTTSDTNTEGKISVKTEALLVATIAEVMTTSMSGDAATVLDAIRPILHSMDTNARAFGWERGRDDFAKQFLEPLPENGLRPPVPNPFLP